MQNGIENLSGTNVSMNAHPDDGYKFRARTKEELIASQQIAASSGSAQAGRTADPARTELNAPEWEDEDRPKIIITDAAPPPPKGKQQPKGWIL